MTIPCVQESNISALARRVGDVEGDVRVIKDALPGFEPLLQEITGLRQDLRRTDANIGLVSRQERKTASLARIAYVEATSRANGGAPNLPQYDDAGAEEPTESKMLHPGVQRRFTRTKVATAIKAGAGGAALGVLLDNLPRVLELLAKLIR